MRSRPLLALLALLASALLLAGCGGGIVIGDIDCDDEMATVTGRLGFPEKIDERFEGGLHIHTFWYWRTGIGITFVWGGDLTCDQRDFRFTPTM